MGKLYWYPDFDGICFNFRMADIQAAVGLVQLRRLEQLNARRREIADHYRDGLSSIPGLGMLEQTPETTHSFHIFAVLVELSFPLNKEELMCELYTGKNIKV